MLFKMSGIISLLMIFSLAQSAAAAEKGASTFKELVVDGIRRNYIVYIPGNAKGEKLPLMIVLHGGLGNAEHIMNVTGMNDVADAGRFAVAYPNGVKARWFMPKRRLWNAGKCCGAAAEENIDDIAFIEAMIGDIESGFPIDSGRIYVTGMSNGAMMAYRLACEIPDKIAAIIPVSGTLAVENCDAARDIPVMHIHGTGDQFVPVAGGIGSKSVAGVPHRSLSDTITLLTRSRRCSEPEVSTIGPGIRVSTYNCGNGAPVVIVLIEGGGHSWPGGNGGLQEAAPGRHFSASSQAWDFARQFRKKELPSPDKK